MNKILKIFGLMAILTVPAFAEDGGDESRVVGERTDCTAVAAEIATINKTEDPDEDMLNRLIELQTIQRRDCSKNTARRRAMGRGGKMAAVVAAANAAAEAEAMEAAEVEEEIVSTPETVADATESVDVADMTCDELINKMDSLRGDEVANATEIEKLSSEYDARCGEPISEDAQEVADLIASGLCADGSKPNKFGCCGEEKFKDLGDGVFGCCPPDPNADCFPPITSGDN